LERGLEREDRVRRRGDHAIATVVIAFDYESIEGLEHV
jgi:hypothetical protein